MAGGVNPAMAGKMAGMAPQATSALANPAASGLIASPAQSAGMFGSRIPPGRAMQTGMNLMNRPQPQPMAAPQVMQQQRQQVRPMASLGQQPGLLNSFQRRRFG
jgi:hypothetical protein